ncbi:hypothetical protein HDU98_007841, partial [Podochytrium sp. JEL0797]
MQTACGTIAGLQNLVADLQNVNLDLLNRIDELEGPLAEAVAKLPPVTVSPPAAAPSPNLMAELTEEQLLFGTATKTLTTSGEKLFSKLTHLHNQDSSKSSSSSTNFEFPPTTISADLLLKEFNFDFSAPAPILETVVGPFSEFNHDEKLFMSDSTGQVLILQ